MILLFIGLITHVIVTIAALLTLRHRIECHNKAIIVICDLLVKMALQKSGVTDAKEIN